EVQDRIEKGTRNLPVKATVTPPPSGIREVAFIFGPSAEFEKAAAANQAFKAKPDDPAGRSWTAALPVPKDASGKLVVTARFKTGVGLTAFAPSEEVTVSEPPPAEDTAKKPAPPKPGAIEGLVVEGDRPQSGLKVFLIDLKPPPDKSPYLGQPLTDQKGTFSFKDLEPKRYRLYCVKQGSDGKREADQQVMV